MREKKLQVFVSSTFTDLIEERQAAVEAILSSGNIPAGMELFTAADESQMPIIKRWIDESDVYMLILGGRYGSIEISSGKSYTQLEYEYAIEKAKPLFAVVLSENALEEKTKRNGLSIIERDNSHKLNDFKKLVTSKMVKFCDDRKDIKLAIHETLSEFSYRKELTGWIRGDNAVNSNLLADEIAKLTKENSELRNLVKVETLYYNGLTFEDLKKLLKNQKCEVEEDEFIGNMYEYIKKYGTKFATGEYSEFPGIVYLNQLQDFNIIKSFPHHKNIFMSKYQFTEDGHKFYLRTLLSKEAQNNDNEFRPS